MYKLIDIFTPVLAAPIKFIFKTGNFGVIKFCDLLFHIHKIDNLQQIISSSNIINIFFSVHNKFYVETHTSTNGFTLDDTIRLLYKTGVNAGIYDIVKNKSKFKTGHDWLSTYSICSSDNNLDNNLENKTKLVINDNNIFVYIKE